MDSMRTYLRAGLAMDVEKLDELYDPAFVNVRVDEAGQVVTLTKDQFMARFRALREQGQKVGDSIDDISFPATSVFGDSGAVVMRRVEEGVPALYTFIWRLEDGRPVTLLREFTFEKDLSGLVEMIRSAEVA
ncbi:protein of unknown function (DUF4440) [Lentzea flava]|nr:protein of unknown function (DUF4440) [Lentzea flava]